MSNPQADRVATVEDSTAIEFINDLRKRLFAIKQEADSFRSNDSGKMCCRELSQGGECVAYFPTGYRVTDNTNEPKPTTEPSAA